MKLIPLGGAEEVGASSTLVEIGGHKILVDAGIRIGQPDSLPDLGRLSDFGGIEAMLVTHAHTDHTGALPVVHRSYPNIPVWATPGTQAITSVLFNDALNIMKSRYEVDREIPLYNRELVNSLFSRMQTVQLGQTVKLFGGDVAATFFPAGHILGAACIGLQSADGESLFISGDISVTPQLTVGGMLPPVSIDKRFRPQVVMVESTYGNRLHANRATEERRLVETVANVVESGGRVLIPAFAVGRAQEVLLILANAMSRKEVAPFPVWVDGMVRSVCGVYTQHPYDLATGLRRLILRSGNPFFGDSSAGGKAADFAAINTPQERQTLAESGTPGCIVASSGMLSGGPSSYYARYLAREAKSAIFITGYQDEESPGRALLALAEATNRAERVLKLDGDTVQVECQVGKYSLSAHVDAGEVAGLIEGLNPQETVLVHGAGGAREALSELLTQSRDRRIHLPRASDELTFAGRKAKRRTVANPASSGDAAELLPEGLLPTEAGELMAIGQKLVETLGDKAAQGRTFTVQELAALWLALREEPREANLSAEQYEQLRTLLNIKESGFIPDKRRPFLYRLNKTTSVDTKDSKETSDLPLHQNAALLMVDQIFPPELSREAGLYKRGAELGRQRLVLYFHFPTVAAVKYATQLEEIATRTGWPVGLNEAAHQEALVNVVSTVLPPEFEIVKTPAIYREKQEVRVDLAYRGTEAAPPNLQSVMEAYKAKTGYTLITQIAGQPQISPTVQPASEVDLGPRTEINAAFARLDEAFAKASIRLLRRSLKNGSTGQFIELSFITAQAGEQQQPLISELQSQLGWPITINPEPNQQALRTLLDQLLSAQGLPPLQKFSVHRDRNAISAKLLTSQPSAEIEAVVAPVKASFEAMTGWQLSFNG